MSDESIDSLSTTAHMNGETDDLGGKTLVAVQGSSLSNNVHDRLEHGVPRCYQSRSVAVISMSNCSVDVKGVECSRSRLED